MFIRIIRDVFQIIGSLSDFHHKSERKMIISSRDQGSFNFGVFSANCFRLPVEAGKADIVPTSLPIRFLEEEEVNSHEPEKNHEKSGSLINLRILNMKTWTPERNTISLFMITLVRCKLPE